MASMRDQRGGLVFSTEKGGATCPRCHEAVDQCKCEQLDEQERLSALDGIVRIRREVAGRKGKGVTTVTGIPQTGAELKVLLKALKQRCGTGGTVKDGVLEIQGDHRDTVAAFLEKKGFKVKLAGG